MRTFLIFITLIFLQTGLSYGQAPDSVYYKRLFHLCKAWGYFKYYHTEIAKGNVNWDDELINVVRGVRNAPDNAAFNDSMLKMMNNAGSMGINTASLPGVIDTLNNNSDYSWISDPVFSEAVRTLLEDVKNKFRPQKNVFVGEAWTGGNPTFNTDNQYYSGENYPTEGKRILALFRYWNIINYFYPYKNIMDFIWDSTLVEFIPQIIEAQDALTYNLVLKRFTTRINDSHAFYYSPTYWSWLGDCYPPFLARFIENKMVITKVLPGVTGIKPGDIIIKIDGEDIVNLRDSLRKYAHGSNDVIIERELNNIIMRGANGSFSITVDDGTFVHSETLNRNNLNYDQLNINTSPVWRVQTLGKGCHIGVVDMGRLQVAEVSLMFGDLMNTDAIIIDIRNYPNNTLWTIVNYLYNSSIHIANFTVPDINYPGRMYWQQEFIGQGTATPYTGKVIMLFDERTQSQAEYTCMGLEQSPGARKIGSTTSGADGNTAVIFLPGNIYTYATFLGVYYPNYKPTQRLGIIPDNEVQPTIKGIREGRDEVMEFALNCNFVGIDEMANSDDIRLFPNPAMNEICFSSTEENIYEIEIFNILGVRLRTARFDSFFGVIDLTGLTEGVYIALFHAERGIIKKQIVKQ